MKLLKFLEFIRESVYDEPESAINSVLNKLKKIIEDIFSEDDDNEVLTMDAKKKKEDETSLKDMGVKLTSSEISELMSDTPNYKVKFSDEDYLYDLTISISLDDALPKKNQSQPEPQEVKENINSEITQCNIDFKKYKIPDLEFVGELTKKINIADFNQNFLINLKVELDDMYKDSDDEFELEIN